MDTGRVGIDLWADMSEDGDGLQGQDEAVDLERANG
jgi:hypothetical protein